MKRLLTLLGLAACLLAPASQSWAQSRTIVRGEGSIAVQSYFASGPSEEERAAALKSARLSAWRAYLAMPGHEEMVDQIRANEQLYLDRLDELLVDQTTVEDNYDKDSKRYTLRIKATVAESVINSMIRTSSRSSVKTQGVGGAYGGGPIMILGMAREADTLKRFMARETAISEASTEATTSETTTEQVKSGRAGRQASVSDSARVSARSKAVTGGSSEHKRDKVSYKIGNVSILNSKLPRILLQNGIKGTQYTFLMRPCRLPNPDSFSKQYAASEQGELPSDVMADIQEKLLACGRAKYWVFASMDTGGYRTDPNTGLNMATVTVNVQLMEVDTGAQIASASRDVPGRSADQTDAIRVATENAVQAVGDIIAAQVASIGK